MPHWRKFFNNQYLGSWSFSPGRDTIVTIVAVKREVLKNPKGEEAPKLVLYIERATKGIVCGVTMARTIAAMYGNDTAKWIGKRVALYVANVMAFGETTEAIRIRPTIPRDDKEPSNTAPLASAAPEPEVVGADEEEEGGFDAAERATG